MNADQIFGAQLCPEGVDLLGPVGRRHCAVVFDQILPRLRAALDAYEQALIINFWNETAATAALQAFGAAVVDLSVADGLMRHSVGTAGEA